MLEPSRRSRRARVAVIGVVAAALAIRLAVLIVTRAATIDMDGTEYVRVAQNLAANHGALGMRGLPMMTFPLFYSAAIAAFALIGGGAEMAARILALIAGVAFVIATYQLARAVYGERAALVAAAIVAVLPVCVNLSTAALTEAPCAALATFGILNVVLFARDGRARHAAFGGAAFGAEYCLRPEGALFAAAALAGIVLITLARRRPPLAAGAFAAAAAVFAIASIGITYAASGRLMLEGKSEINFRLADGLRSGASYLSVADAVDANGRPVGPEIDPRYYRPGTVLPRVPLPQRVSLAARAAANHVRESIRVFETPWYGGGLLIALGILGVAGPPWPRGRRRDQLVLAAYLATAFVALAGVWQFWPRYGMIFMPVVVLWSAHGVEHLRRWSARSRLPDAGLGAFVLLVAVSLTFDVAAARDVERPLERSAGAWIAAHGPRTPLIADVGTATAFYAGGVWAPLPYGDERASSRYLRALDPAFIVLDSERGEQYPPIRSWFAEGVPAALATAVYAIDDGAGRRLTVYRLAPAVSYGRGR